MAVAVRAAEQVLGFIFVIGDESTLNSNAGELLVEAARMAAVHMVRARDIGDVERRSRREALRQLLDGTREPSLRAALGLENKQSAGVLAIRPVAPTPDDNQTETRWLENLVVLAVRVEHPDALCVTLVGTTYVVIASARDLAPDLVPVAGRIVDRTAHHGHTLRVGIAPSGPIDELDCLRRDADRALAALAMRGDARAAGTIDEMRHLAVLDEIRTLAEQHPDLLAGPVGALIDGEPGTPPWGLATLRAFVDCFGRLPEAAAELAIHPNTLRYRLSRLSDVLGLDLNDPDQRLVLALQLRLLVPR